MHTKYTLFLFLVVVLLISGCVNDSGRVACTEDARLCPDGSSVARVPPKCDFAPCPSCTEGDTINAECPDGTEYLSKSCDENGVWHEVAYVRNPCENFEETSIDHTDLDKTRISKEYTDAEMSGIYPESQIWSGSILITGDTTIDGDLTILPGTIIKFEVSDDQNTGREVGADGYMDDDPTRFTDYGKTHSSLSVSGKLNASGKEDNRIIFTTASENPSYADWVNVHVSGDGSLIEHCLIEWSRNGITLGHDTPNTIVRYNIINYTYWCAVCSDFSGAKIYGNEIWEVGHEGIDVQGGNPVIEDNMIYNAHTGIVVISGTSTIRNNVMVNVGNGIHVNPQASLVNDNNSIELATDSSIQWCYGDFAYNMFGDPGTCNY